MYPKSHYTLGPTLRRVWREPWRSRARLTPRQRRRLRRALNKAGLITPHFSWTSARCHDGTPVPLFLRSNAIQHAWRLEKLRHRLGDRPMPITSWYRHWAYNKRIGGAIFSRHLFAHATDIPKSYIDRVGRKRFFAVADDIFANGGVGDYPAGSAHVDSRGWRARWSSFIGW